ncbi:hypothetical protein POTOM_036399 [Populus tomentosa]|uniref:DUF155 domain-containing protein n=1 Tax=Populus tomentosa TaxID=118781 RepID=A0A8X7Z4B1_POPTO|nr:hypothetical protein POTOM_036399 [Populus tomentosa]
MTLSFRQIIPMRDDAMQLTPLAGSPGRLLPSVAVSLLKKGYGGCLHASVSASIGCCDNELRSETIHGFGSINLKSMQAENLSYVVPPTSRSTNYVSSNFSISLQILVCRYMVVFQYGSAVLFNIEDPELKDYAIKEKPLLDEDMQGGLDYIVLKTLDTDSIRIIGSVLGQSIALDYLFHRVAGINRAMEKTGTFSMDRKKLLQLVGKANSNLADVILKVGLFESLYHLCSFTFRSEIAWRDAKYAQIYEYLREEYEVTQRFGNLDFKLKFVEVCVCFYWTYK